MGSSLTIPGILKALETEVDVAESLKAREHAVKLIDDEIEVLMCAVRQLQFRRSQHIVHIKHFRGLTNLARRILPEILARIIDECVLDGWTRMPLIASHVCPEWRKATKAPTVWSHIYVNCDAKDPCGRTRLWLENAQTSPLRITVDVTNDMSRISPIMDLLMTRAAQWQMLTITSSLLYHANSILALCNRPVPGLHTLSISVVEEFDDNIDVSLESVLDLQVSGMSLHAPHLHTLRIDRNIISSPRMIPSQITSLSISLSSFQTATKLSVDRALTLLDALPTLQKLSISFPYRQARQLEPALDEHRQVYLSDLDSLVLVGSPDLFRLLPHLATPSLSSLHLRSSINSLGYPDAEIGLNIRKFIETTVPPLELLDLHDVDLSPSNFIACFAMLPHLRDLRLHESDIPDLVIDQFAQHDGLCPLLEKLDLRWCGQITGRALVSLVHNRLRDANIRRDACRASGPPISQITVIHCSFIQDDDLLEMSQTTNCQILAQAGDYCRPYGCCQNARYRKRLHQHGLLQGDGVLRRLRPQGLCNFEPNQGLDTTI